jgi:hypothetical protein
MTMERDGSKQVMGQKAFFWQYGYGHDMELAFLLLFLLLLCGCIPREPRQHFTAVFVSFIPASLSFTGFLLEPMGFTEQVSMIWIPLDYRRLGMMRHSPVPFASESQDNSK